MNEYLVTRYSPNAYPKLEVRRVVATDLMQAIAMSGYALTEIVAARLNLDVQAVN